MWTKASNSTNSDFSVVSRNELGAKLKKDYNKFFRTLRAIPQNAEYFKAIWCPPVMYDFEIKDKLSKDIDGLGDDIFSGQLFDLTASNSELDSEGILEVFCNKLISLANSTKAPGQDQSLLIYGEPGSGKTTTINAVMTIFRDKFKKNRIFWMRFGVLEEFSDPLFNIIGLRDSFYYKFYMLLLNDPSAGYISELNLDNAAVIQDIFPNQYSAILRSGSSAESNISKLVRYFRNHTKEFFDDMTFYLYHVKNYSLFFIIDNIDNIDERSPEKRKKASYYIYETLKIIFGKTYIRIPSLRLLITRGETIKKYCGVFKDGRKYSQYNVKHIGSPNPFCIFDKRLIYIKKEYHKNKASYELPPDKLFSIYNNYIKASVDDGNKEINPIIVKLSNYNITKMFNMALEIINTHILSFDHMFAVSDNPDESLIRLKEHHIVWALLLRNRRLFYKNDSLKTWIYNIYDNYNDLIEFEGKSSILIKRLILDYFPYYYKDTNLDVISNHQFYDLFVNQFKYIDIDLERSLNDFLENELLYAYEDRGISYYYLTSKGNYIRKNIAELYIYLELICEDTPVPEEKVINFNLEKYDPILNREKYLRKKITMVREFVNFLEEKEEEEINQRNLDIPYCTKRYFPGMKMNLKEQELNIGRSFGKDMLEWINNNPKPWK